MPPLNKQTQLSMGTNGSAYWRSLDELANTARFREFVEREFPVQAQDMLEGSSRRNFLKIMAASICLAGVTGCRWPKEKIVPFSHRADNRTPGTPQHFATAQDIGGVANGLLVTSYDGRPIKIEGNPLHPVSCGSASAVAQASVLELYDPDRSKYPVFQNGNQEINQDWDSAKQAIQKHFAALKPGRGQGVAFLAESSSSLTTADIRNRVSQVFPESRWFEYESVSDDQEREGTRLALGQPARVQYRFAKASIIVSLDADLLGLHPGALQWSREITAKRKPPQSSMNRLYSIEPSFSITGGFADHRLPVRAAYVQRFGYALAAELILKRNLQLPADYAGLADALRPHLDHSFDPAWVKSIADDLIRNRGASVIAVGYNQPAQLHALGVLLNDLLGNRDETVVYSQVSNPGRPTHVEAIQTLAGDMQAGKIDTLVVLGGNPVYDAPADLEFATLVKNIKHSFHLSLYRNETSLLCSWHIPRAHYLETWSDARAFDGTVSIVQPLIEPLYQGLNPNEFLALVTGEPVPRGYELTRRALQNHVAVDDFEKAWKAWLNKGLIPNSQFKPVLSSVRVSEVRNQIPSASGEQPGLEVVFLADAKVLDGRFANNSWLQETPDFLTKLTWDNAALVAPATAKELGLSQGDMVRLTLGNAVLTTAVYVMPGQAPGSVGLLLGYGRTQAGQVGNGVGFAVEALRTSQAMHFASGLEIVGLGKKYELATTQDHYAIDRVGMEEKGHRIAELIQEGSVVEFDTDPDHFLHTPHTPPINLWKEHEYNGNRWGMAIDLNACTGCNACVTGCQAENNIPVVGKEQVLNGREMHWIRLDRYFGGAPENPRIAHQPVGCVHCENAPCEQVCPVAATVHSSEGLNVMVYNRCVGTRYCANNCPFKVRRFNFFNYQKNLAETAKMVYNPEVTVRSRGVMEKCTYCVQRIESVKIKAKNVNRPIEDGEIVPACAQACPTNAIVFGDLNDPNSAVSQLHADQRAYSMLGELHVKPRTAYLARLRNPNPELMDSHNESRHHDA
jgi:MoCo/4Fe-4S cofactor protein with predicted Tat translocation signal